MSVKSNFSTALLVSNRSFSTSGLPESPDAVTSADSCLLKPTASLQKGKTKAKHIEGEKRDGIESKDIVAYIKQQLVYIHP